MLEQTYKEGFITTVENNDFTKGLSSFIIKIISKKRKEPFFLIKFRLAAYKKWKKMHTPEWSTLNIPFINYQKFTYFSKPKKNFKNSDVNIVKTFQNLGITLDNQKIENNFAIDAVFDSVSIVTTFKEKLAKVGIIFCSILEAIEKYPKLVKKHLGSIVSANDNYFAALNSAIFTDGSFCFIPQNTISPLNISTYFRINNENAGQFERTLIIAEKNSKVNYFEGCSAPIYKKNQLHAAIVELLALEKAEINYSTIQNWYSGDANGIGGIYNFVTKRGACIGKRSKITWTQLETGSSITWKYPSCILIGQESIGEFFSLALTKNYQQADTGTKMVHLGNKTKSKILSKGISSGNSTNTYRGLVKIAPSSFFSRNFSQCDSYIINSNAFTSAYPYFDIKNSSALVEHEANVSKINEEQLFYLSQRGINEEKAISFIIIGFCKDILNQLPLEFSSEAKKLLNINFEKIL
jgi:Fe-S cluster assembly protein SufB